ncbi:MAG: hypothetical protein ACF8NJ_05970 [Phycisphaerales bacterium JB038]
MAFQEYRVGPFASKEECIESQSAATVPPGGGMTGFVRLPAVDKDAAEAYFYIMLLPAVGAGGNEINSVRQEDVEELGLPVETGPVTLATLNHENPDHDAG